MRKTNLLKNKKTRTIILLSFILSCCYLLFNACSIPRDQHRVAFGWTHLSTSSLHLSIPTNSSQQTASLILDVNNDGINDFVIGSRREPGPSLSWYQRNADSWTKFVIEDSALDIEAGGAFYDIDSDGDPDIVMGGDSLSNNIWWWENPFPVYDPAIPWTRRVIKNSGTAKHHDQIFGDFDNDGEAELVFWNQGAQKLFISDIPSDPANTQPWAYTEIYSSSGQEEGLSKSDIDGDGQMDILAGGRWFKHNGETSYTANIIGNTNAGNGRIAAGQLIEGGRPEVVIVPGDATGRLKWYEWLDNTWVGHDLLGFDVDHGHSLSIADINGDTYPDIFVAEMRLNGGNSDAKMWIFYGDGTGKFTTTVITTGFDNHESKLGDLDGDGDMDILGKPYNWKTPRLDIWLNDGPGLPLDLWERHIIDSAKPWKAIFISSADMNGDKLKDIVTGGWWYKNPGNLSNRWVRNTIGDPLNNMAAIYDFDKDGNMDVLGTKGKGSESDNAFVWAHNNGKGRFTIFNNIPDGSGDFLQGTVVDSFRIVGKLEAALSWHDGSAGVTALTIPGDPVNEIWTWNQVSTSSQAEGLSAGDIDSDGKVDILIGTKWLRNEVTFWSAYTLFNTDDSPDRNRLADIDGDGDLDAVVGFEAISRPGKLAWYEQGIRATDLWTEHVIETIIGPMSVDVADIDKDGDIDVVAGEHNLLDPSSARLYIFENKDGAGAAWTKHLVFQGDEHHDGTQLVDIDADGDLDIISIGWSHGRILLYENKAR